MNTYLASQGPALANHLWQSTAFAVVAWLLTLALRKNQARVRYVIWLTASIKFLVPFSLLVSAGNLLPHPKQPVAEVVYSAMDVVEDPFPAAAVPAATSPVHVRTLRQRAEEVMPGCLGGLWLAGAGSVILGWWNRWRILSANLRRATSVLEGREFGILRRLESERVRGRSHTGLRLLMSAERMEPGIFGVVHPVLVWPEQLSAQLDDDHIEAILTHELMHVRRRDNLAALIHMLVESVFWFYPLVWWMERQMVKERELACDEAVAELGGDAEIYVESLLKTCRFCIESPLTCAAGVTGSNLMQRIEHILTARVNHRLEPLKMAALGALAVLVVGIQVFFGAASGVRAQSAASHLTFDAASIRVTNDNNPRALWGTFQFLPGGRLVAKQIPLTMLISAAYNLPFQSLRISFAPGVKPPKENYDITAVGPASEFPAGISVQARDAKLRLMLQSLLADRFQLRIRIEHEEQPAYVLMMGKGGPKLDPSKRTQEECETNESCHDVGGGQGRGIHGSAVSIGDVALFVQNWTDKPVVDETGLNGLYNIQTEGWTPMRIRPANPDGSAPSGPDAGLNDVDRQTLFQVFEQLGLHMESKRVVVDMYVVDSVEKPTEN